MKGLLVAAAAFGAFSANAQYTGRSGVQYANEGVAFAVQRTGDWSADRRDGRCTVRVRIDDEADVELQGEQIRIRTIRGAPGLDLGTQCNAPLPASGEIRNFRFRAIDGRGTARLVQEPAARNFFVGVVNVRDPRGGAGAYTFDLSWDWYGAGGGLFPEPPMTRPTPLPGGSAVLPQMNTSFAGSGTLVEGNQRHNLTEASVRVRGSQCEVALLTDRRQRLEMTGSIARNAPRCVISSSNRGPLSANAYIHLRGNVASGLDVSGNFQGRNFQGSFRDR